MLCCINCFDDKVLKTIISRDGNLGNCSYCETMGIKSIDPSSFGEIFECILEIYQPLEIGENLLPEDNPIDFGESLGDLLDEDWSIFSDSFPTDLRGEFLDEVFNGRLSPKEYSSGAIPVLDLWAGTEKSFSYVPPEHDWDTFVRHIKAERRFVFRDEKDDSFNRIEDPRSWLPQMLENVEIVMNAGEVVFRARVMEVSDSSNPQAFPAKKMGAPPAEKTTAARANTAGIPVLYAATDQTTAIAEVRPWKGAYVSVAACTLNGPVRLADLSERPYLSDGPFAHGFLGDAIDTYSLLRRLADDLSKPLNPRESEIEYIPTQYLTEVIKNSGFDGMLYPSAMGDGKNVVLFDLESLGIDEVKLVRVGDVRYSYYAV